MKSRKTPIRTLLHKGYAKRFALLAASCLASLAHGQFFALQSSASGSTDSPSSINYNGNLVGGYAYDYYDESTSSGYEGFYWAPTTGRVSWPFPILAMSNDGTVLAGTYLINGGPNAGYYGDYYVKGVFHYGAVGTGLNLVSGDGKVIYGTKLRPGTSTYSGVYVYTDGTSSDWLTPAPAASFLPIATSYDGVCVGNGFDAKGNPQCAMYFDNNGSHVIPTPGYAAAQATSIDGNADIIAGIALNKYATYTDHKAFFYNVASGITTYLPGTSFQATVSYDGLSINGVFWINNLYGLYKYDVPTAAYRQSALSPLYQLNGTINSGGLSFGLNYNNVQVGTPPHPETLPSPYITDGAFTYYANTYLGYQGIRSTADGPMVPYVVSQDGTTFAGVQCNINPTIPSYDYNPSSFTGTGFVGKSTVSKPDLYSVVSPPTIAGGSTVLVYVTLAAPLSYDISVQLTSSNAALKVPGYVRIPAGYYYAWFYAQCTNPTAAFSAVIDANLNGKYVSQTVSVLPSAPEKLIAPASVEGGQSFSVQVVIPAAVATNTAIVLTSSSPNVKVPASVIIPAKALSATFTATSVGVNADTPVSLVGTLGSTKFAAALTVLAAKVKSLSVSPASVVGGNPSQLTVTLTALAGPSGISVGVQSNDPSVANLSTKMAVAAQKSTATVSIPTTAVKSTTTVTLTTYGVTGSSSTKLTVTP